MPELATFDDLATLIAFQEAAYAGNRAIKGVEPLPLQVDYRDILARMEVWIDGPKAEPNGVIILDLDHEPTGTELLKIGCLAQLLKRYGIILMYPFYWCKSSID